MKDDRAVSSAARPALIEELQTTFEREIPISAQMGICVHQYDPQGLVVAMPLKTNRNHQQTAFAGSLNALCTITGWGATFLMLRELGISGNIVIRRSTIRYHEPVTTPEILACCQPVTREAQTYFVEMLKDKGQAKLDLTVEISDSEQASVTFQGSYVVVSSHAKT
jgi:thioesterase domain-containing protein